MYIELILRREEAPGNSVLRREAPGNPILRREAPRNSFSCVFSMCFEFDESLDVKLLGINSLDVKLMGIQILRREAPGDFGM